MRLLNSLYQVVFRTGFPPSHLSHSHQILAITNTSRKFNEGVAKGCLRLTQTERQDLEFFTITQIQNYIKTMLKSLKRDPGIRERTTKSTRIIQNRE